MDLLVIRSGTDKGWVQVGKGWVRVKESCGKGMGKKVERVRGDMKIRVRLVNGGGEKVALKILVRWSGMDKGWGTGWKRMGEGEGKLLERKGKEGGKGKR